MSDSKSPHQEREILLRKIENAETQLCTLKQTQAEIETHLSDLCSQLQAIDDKATSIPEDSRKKSNGLHPTKKVQLFRQLFKGREDVFPRLWNNAKTGRKGYSPACSNEWVRGLCEKPRVKCGECTQQAFLTITDQVILDHLQGRHVIGVYPLLLDETCWFLAVDFDKEAWQEDVLEFAKTCHKMNLPIAIERSRSGNGAHVWFFFSTPIPAVSARKLGCLVITKTMERRHQLSMASYDRLFPNQDNMPSGGFGNLIALPLQHHPRQIGNTVFLDEDLQSIPDQWNFLASLRRSPLATVETIVNSAAKSGGVIGVQVIDRDNKEPFQPWIHSGSGNKAHPQIEEPVPSTVQVVLSQRLFVTKTGVPSTLLNQIKRLAAFQNPEFYKKQALRLSTALTPRVISCAEEFPEHVSLPRGCQEDLENLLKEYGSRVEIEDLRISGKPLNVSFHGELTKTQQNAAQELLAHDIGTFVAPPGTGKTVLGTYLIAERKYSTLVLVHRQPLLAQWRSQLSIFLGMDPKDIGHIGSGKKKITGQIDVAMIQSLSKNEAIDDIVKNYGQVIIDECHHLSAVSFERVLNAVPARYIIGLTATPKRRDGQQPIVHMQLGPVRHKIDSKGEAAKHPFIHQLFVRKTGFDLPNESGEPTIQEIYRLLAEDKSRNELIFNDVLEAMEEGRSPILLTERREHLELLHDRLRSFVRHIIVLQGGKSAKQQRLVQEQLASISPGEERLILATGRYIGEGFDDARLDTLFLTLPVSWRGTLVQYAGRLHRQYSGKQEVRIVDYVDSNILMLARMFDKRLRGYKAMGYVTDIS